MSKRSGKGVSIQTRLLVSHLVLVVLIVLIGVVGVRNIYKVYNNSKYFYDNNFQTINDLQALSQNIREIDRLMSAVTTKDGHGSVSTSLNDIVEMKGENDELIKKCLAADITSAEIDKIRRCKEDIEAFNHSLDSLITLVNDQNNDKAYATYEREFASVKENTLKHIDETVELVIQNGGKSNEENQMLSRRVAIIAVLTGIAAMAVGVFIALAMSRYITKRLESIRNLAKRLAEYDVSDDIQSTHEDELGLTMSALNDSQFIIRDLMEQIIDESSEISEIGHDVSEAVKTSGERIQAVNVQMLEYAKMSENISDSVKIILENRKLDDEVVRRLRNILRESAKAESLQTEARGELRSINMLLEQIVITADLQNEIAKSHKEKIDKFKV